MMKINSTYTTLISSSQNDTPRFAHIIPEHVGHYILAVLLILYVWMLGSAMWRDRGKRKHRCCAHKADTQQTEQLCERNMKDDNNIDPNSSVR